MKNLIFMQNTKKKDWTGGGEIFGVLFSKKVPFMANIERYPKFLD